MIDLNKFISKWDDKVCNYGNLPSSSAYYRQCVQLAKQWEEENGWPIIMGNAIDEKNNFDNNYYQWIANTPDGVPKPGDLVIWNYSPNGHIAIFVSGDMNSFISFDQNYPVGSVCHTQKHNYNNVIGWIHPKDNQPVGGNVSVSKDFVKSLYQTVLLRDPESDDVVSSWANSSSDQNKVETDFRAAASHELTDRLKVAQADLTACQAKTCPDPHTQGYILSSECPPCLGIDESTIGQLLSALVRKLLSIK